MAEYAIFNDTAFVVYRRGFATASDARNAIALLKNTKSTYVVVVRADDAHDGWTIA
jgi:hypothetical protein